MLRNFARARAVIGFINSEGWKLNPAIENHDLDPFISLPKNKTRINKNIIKIYTKLAYLKYILLFGIIETKKTKIHMRQKKSCLPKKLFNEKASIPSKYVTE